MKALDSSFPDGHPVKHILNRHTVKLLYRTTLNMATIFSRHNSSWSSCSQRQMSRPGSPAARKPWGTAAPAKWEGSVFSITQFIRPPSPRLTEQWPGPNLHWPGLHRLEFKTCSAQVLFQALTQARHHVFQLPSWATLFGSWRRRILPTKLTGKSWIEHNPSTQP